MAKSRNRDEAIEYLQGKATPSDMSVEFAISLVGSRDGRPEEDDWDLIEAAEVLAREVANLQLQIELAKLGM